MIRALKLSILTAAMLGLASGTHAGNEGEPAQNCEGNTFQIVECLKARTAQWDKRMTVAYQKGDGTGLLPAVEAPFDGRIPDDAPDLGEAYTKRALAAAEKRVVFAGKRLADRMRLVLK